MEKRKKEALINQEVEIDLRVIFNSLVERRFLIASLTGFVTVLAILYTLNLTQIYKVSTSFTSPSTTSVTSVSQLKLIDETKESIFAKFLTLISSKELQKIAFVEGDFLTLFNPDNSPIDDVDAFISSALGSVRVNSPRTTKKDMELGFLTELPYSVTMEGANAEAISEYLNSLTAFANSKTILGLINHNELKISNRLYEISLERDSLLEQAERNRFSQIERIKEEDAQKRRQINDQIDRERTMAKEKRLNQIAVLMDASKLAKSLGIIENNFKMIKGSENFSDLTIAIGEDKDLPEWYTYGEKALLQRVEILKNRKNDDPLIPELVKLRSQLNEVQNNNLLETLTMRQDDSPFIDQIVNLDIETIKLGSIIGDISSISSMQISQDPLTIDINLNKKMIVLLAFFGSFIMSVFLVLIMGALKPDKKVSPA